MCVGLLLLLLRPPLPRALDAMWDTAHVPEDERDDVEVYGARPTAKAAWPAWTLLVTCLLGVLATTSASPAQSPAMQVRVSSQYVCSMCVRAEISVEGGAGEAQTARLSISRSSVGSD